MRTALFLISFAALAVSFLAFWKSRPMPGTQRLAVRIYVSGGFLWIAVILAIVGHFIP